MYIINQYGNFFFNQLMLFIEIIRNFIEYILYVISFNVFFFTFTRTFRFEIKYYENLNYSNVSLIKTQ